MAQSPSAPASPEPVCRLSPSVQTGSVSLVVGSADGLLSRLSVSPRQLSLVRWSPAQRHRSKTPVGSLVPVVLPEVAGSNSGQVVPTLDENTTILKKKSSRIGTCQTGYINPLTYPTIAHDQSYEKYQGLDS